MSEETQQQSSPLKPRATIEDLLNLPPEGYEAIGKMTEEELAVYLAGVCELEPKIPPDAQWRGVKEKKEKKTKETTPEGQDELELEGEQEEGNPIKQQKKRKKKTSGPSQEEIDEILADL